MDEVLLQIKLKNIEKKLDRIATLLEEIPQVMAATILLMKQEVDEASMQGKRLLICMRSAGNRSKDDFALGFIWFFGNRG